MLHRHLPMYFGAYVDGFVQGVDAILTIHKGAINSIILHGLFRKNSDDHCPQLAKTATVDAAGSEPLKDL